MILHDMIKGDMQSTRFSFFPLHSPFLFSTKSSFLPSPAAARSSSSFPFVNLCLSFFLILSCSFPRHVSSPHLLTSPIPTYSPFLSPYVTTGGNGADPDNLLALAVIAARERATLGEISFALEAEWGRHVATTQVVQGTLYFMMHVES